MMEELLDANALPDWFAYPADFLELFHSGMLDLGPWQILAGNWLRVRHDGLKKRFPARSLVPFARRLDNDDIACWEQGNPDRVCVVHDFSAPGWERRAEFDSFAAWRHAAEAEADRFDGAP